MYKKHFGFHYSENDISHHGILGQKWGIRRYQNPDGSLTPEGRLRYAATAINKHIKEYDGKLNNYKREFVKAGLFKDKLEKGTTIIRYSNKKREDNSDFRKYASVEKHDSKVYENDAIKGGIGTKKGDTIYRHEYKLTKNIKIAKPDKVLDDILNTYAKPETKEAYKKYKKLNLRNSYYTLQRFFGDPDNKDHWIFDYAADLQQQIIDPIHEIMYNPKISTKIFAKYKAKGYGAIGDPEDYVYGYDYPMIMIDPKSTMKLTSSKKTTK